PMIKLATPAGNPALSIHSKSLIALAGVWLAGFSTTVHPAANAGANFRVIIETGKFHGVIAATGPTGWLTTWIRLLVEDAGTMSPETRLASSAYHKTYSAAIFTSPLASFSGLPMSSVIDSAKLSFSSMIAS